METIHNNDLEDRGKWPLYRGGCYKEVGCNMTPAFLGGCTTFFVKECSFLINWPLAIGFFWHLEFYCFD